MSNLHSTQTANHIIESYTYADAAARTGATGFVSADLGKVAFQQDNSTYWRLTATAPTWLQITGAGSGGAPPDAKYITQTHDSTLSAEQALGDLATGLLKNTTTTGVLSIATAADLPSHDHTGTSDGGKLTNDDHDGYSLYEEISAPSTPASNTLRLYAKDKSGVTELFYQNDGGTERDLSGLVIEEADASPTGTATKLVLPNGTLGYAGSVATYTPAAITSGSVSDFNEAVDDEVNALIVDGTALTKTYNDGANTLTLDVDIGTTSGTAAAGDHTHTSSGVTDFNEAVDDRVNGLLVAGTGISTSYNDSANTYTITAIGGGTGQNIWSADYPPASASSDDNEFATSIADFTEWDPPALMTPNLQAWGMDMTYASGNAYKTAGMYKTAPAGDWAIYTKVSLMINDPANYFFGGLLLGEDLVSNPNTSDVISWGIFRGGLPNSLVLEADWQTQYDAGITSQASLNGYFPISFMYLRIRRISTTLYYDYSCDGIDWIAMNVNGVTQHFTAAQYGLCVRGNNSKTSHAVFQFFRKTTDTSFYSPLLGRRL